uniref:mirror-image polydactyly gene 1 protein isoform X2 n=1 Tax=Pristiophorus japonicus TaxID=55135 RepID=UPI00398E3123
MSANQLQQVQAAVRTAAQQLFALKLQVCEKDAALENELELRLVVQKQNEQLKSTLVDIYKTNPKVNEELNERLPVSKKRHCRQLEKEELETSLENFYKDLNELAVRSEILEEKTRSQRNQNTSEMQMEDDEHGAQNTDEKWKQEKTESTTCNLAFKNTNNTQQQQDLDKCLFPQAVEAEHKPLQPCLRKMHDSTEWGTCTDKDLNMLQVNGHTHSHDKSQELPPSPNSSQQLVALEIDSSDWTQQHHDLPRTCSFHLEDDECSNSKRETDTMTPLPKSSTMTITPVFSAQYCQRINSEMKLNIQSKMEANNIRAENRGSNAPGDPFTPGQVTKLTDDNRRIAFLLKELNAVRESNKKLQDKLSEKEHELEVLKLDTELQEKAVEAKIAEKAAVLVEEVYHAQKERDAAVMSRLRLANEERDEALLRAKQLEQAFEGLENINPEENDMTLQELLNRINNADTRRAVDKNGDLIVDRIHKTRERKKRITAEEMNAVIEERDAALARCKRLEQELYLLKEQNQTMANNTRQLTAENNQERALKAQLLTTQKERDSVFQQCKKQDEEIQTLRLYYSLHKSLSQEASLTDQFNFALSTYDDALRASEGIMSATQHQNEELANQLQLAVAERANMEIKLQQALEAKNELNEEVQKLERLVDVLRKKVGTGNIRTVT